MIFSEFQVANTYYSVQSSIKRSIKANNLSKGKIQVYTYLYIYIYNYIAFMYCTLACVLKRKMVEVIDKEGNKKTGQTRKGLGTHVVCYEL